MHAVAGADLEPRLAVFLDDLVDARRAITLRGFVKLRQVVFDRHGFVPELQVRRLVLFMIRAREEHRRQPVETDDAVRFRIVDGLCFGRFVELLVIGIFVAPCERHLPESNILVDERECRTPEGSQLVQPRAEVACAVKLLVYP